MNFTRWKTDYITIHFALHPMDLKYYCYYFKSWQCKAGIKRLTPYQSEDPSPKTQYPCTHRMKEEKWKALGDKKVDGS